MKRLLAFALILTAVAAFAQKSAVMPEYVAKAKRVMVITPKADDPSKHISPEDRQAVADVNRALRDWGHYKLTFVRSAADLVIVVHRVRTGTRTGVTINGATNGQITGSRTFGGDGSEAEDEFIVYDANANMDSVPLWRASMKDGLDPENLKLVDVFRHAVEQASAPASK
jgi:hypothetical protein